MSATPKPERPKLTSCVTCGNTVVVGMRCNGCSRLAEPERPAEPSSIARFASGLQLEDDDL